MYIMPTVRLALNVAILALSRTIGDLSLFHTKYGYIPDASLVVSAVVRLIISLMFSQPKLFRPMC
jgi:hypothetical protein